MNSSQPNVYVRRYGGNIYRIPMMPYESEQIASERSWYIAKNSSHGLATNELYDQSKRHVLSKVHGIVY